MDGALQGCQKFVGFNSGTNLKDGVFLYLIETARKFNRHCSYGVKGMLKNVITTISTIILLGMAPPVSGFSCKSTYEPHSSAMNIAMERFEGTSNLDLSAVHCRNANLLRLGLWFMENCNRSSLSQTEQGQLDAQMKVYRDGISVSVRNYKSTYAGNAPPCECPSDISNYCMD